MNRIGQRIVKNLYTTVGGIAAGAMTGAAMSVYNGQITKEAIITGAIIGAAGAILKDPKFVQKKPAA